MSRGYSSPFSVLEAIANKIARSVLCMLSQCQDFSVLKLTLPVGA